MKRLNSLIGVGLLLCSLLPSTGHAQDAAPAPAQPAEATAAAAPAATPAPTPVPPPPVFIEPDILDIEKIKSEEKLSETSKLNRVYIFLAVFNGNSYDTYVASGESDKDKDGIPAFKEPNDLSEYTPLTAKLNKTLNIPEDEHICYISTMPSFSSLFPNQKNPFDSNSMLPVPTEAKPEANHRLIGKKSIPLYDNFTGSLGIERFIAFYNKNENESDAAKKGIITSYGFISIQIEDEK